MRIGFTNKLLEIMEKDGNVHFLTGDLGFSYFESFSGKFPDRFLNVGLSEQNMIGIASGLSLSGKMVFVYSIIPFLIYRPFEQIRLDICSMKLGVKFIGYGGGFSYGQLGVTHFAIEDVAIMRSLPGMTIICPADRVQASIFTGLIYEYETPVYMRLSGNYENVYDSANAQFTIGKGAVIRDGEDIALISNGNMLGESLKTAEILEKNNYSVRVIDMHTVKPVDASLIKKTSKSVHSIFTIEEHNIIGGLGSAVGEILLEDCHFCNIFRKFGVRDAYIKFIGTHDYIRKRLGLNSEALSKSMLKIMGNDKR